MTLTRRSPTRRIAGALGWIDARRGIDRTEEASAYGLAGAYLDAYEVSLRLVRAELSRAWGGVLARHEGGGRAVSAPHEVEFLKRRRPCWHCSKSLQFVKGRGYYSPTAVIDGFKRNLHLTCLQGLAINEEGERLEIAS